MPWWNTTEGISSQTHLRNRLIQLDHRHRLPQTPKAAIPKREPNHLVHLLDLLAALPTVWQPALGAEDLDVHPEDVMEPHQAPAVPADGRATGDEAAVDDVALRRHLFG